MKKIFTLLFGMIATVSVFAADHRPSVVLNSYGNYMVVIDGHRFDHFGGTLNLSNLDYGMHSVKVIGMGRGFWGRPRVVSMSSFEVGREDVVINVNRFGDVQVNEVPRYGWRHDGDDFHHRDWDRD